MENAAGICGPQARTHTHTHTQLFLYMYAPGVAAEMVTDQISLFRFLFVIININNNRFLAASVDPVKFCACVQVSINRFGGTRRAIGKYR